MIPRFDYLHPTSLEDALDVLSKRAGGVTVLAGGTDVVAGMQQDDSRFTSARALMDISGITELARIGDAGIVGSAATFAQIAAHPWICAHYPLLADAARRVGSAQIRNRATIGGNVVNNAACADSVPPLLAYDARVRIRSARGAREVALAEFLLRPSRTGLLPDELVTGFVLPDDAEGVTGRFYKLGRRRGVAISRITLAVLLRIEHGHVNGLRVAAGAVSPIGMRFPELEVRAAGMAADEATWSELSQKLAESVLKVTGLRWSSAYKLPVVAQALFGMLCELSEESRT